MAYTESFDQDDESKKKKRFRLFDSQREGRGVEKEDIYEKRDLKGFFISLKLHFQQLIPLNLLMVFGNFPIFFALIGLSGLFRYSYFTPHNDLYANFAGLFFDQGGTGALTSAWHTIFATATETSMMTTGNYVFLGLSLLMAFTFGIVNTGATYLTREMVAGDPVFFLEDFVNAVKRNFKQGFLFGILDFIILVLLIPFNLYYFFTQESYIMSFLFWTMVVIALVYLAMRSYVYLQIVTFDLPLHKILKNAFIFALINVKRNLLSLLGTTILLIFDLGCLFMVITVPLGIVIPLAIFFSLSLFMATYAGYFKMVEMMVPDEEADTSELPNGSENQGDSPDISSAEI